MADTPEQIQRQIEDTRAELAATVEQIADRVSPKKVATRGVAAAREKVTATFTTTADDGSTSVKWVLVGEIAGGVLGLLVVRRTLKKKKAAAPRKAALRHAREAAERAAKAKRKGKPEPVKGRALRKAAQVSAELQVALLDLQKAIAAHTPEV